LIFGLPQKVQPAALSSAKADENENSPALQRWVTGQQQNQSPRSGRQTLQNREQ
jgi:hypothetical protein